MKNSKIILTMVSFLSAMAISCASQTYLQTPLSQKRLRFHEAGYLYWKTCKKEKGIWGKLTSKENCAEWFEEKFFPSDFKKLKDANFRALSIDTYEN